jgi:hypothetical protein
MRGGEVYLIVSGDFHLIVDNHIRQIESALRARR